MVSHGKKTQYGRMRQTNIAARETIHVSKNVTNITQTLWTCISDEPNTDSVIIPISISKRGCLNSLSGLASSEIQRESHVVVYSRNQNSPSHEKPVHHWYIQLSMKDFRRVDHLNLWEEGQFHDLSQKLKCGQFSQWPTIETSFSLPGMLL
jgi:hypothetical protein